MAVAFSPLSGRAQRQYRVGWLTGIDKEPGVPQRQFIVDRFSRHGFVESQNLVFHDLYAEGKLERMPALAKEIARHAPHALLASGTQAAVALRDATRDAPIVFALVSDPVGSGLMANLSHPEGRITGFTTMNYELVGKRLELLRDAFPAIGSVAVLHDRRNVPERRTVEILRPAASALRIDLRVYEIGEEQEFSKAFAAIERNRPDALLVLENAANTAHRNEIFEVARRFKLPAIYGFDSYVDAGGLMSYSAPTFEQFAGAVDYIARILRGTKVADLPVQLPSRFELVVNMRTARSTGIAIPASFLARADRVIE